MQLRSCCEQLGVERVGVLRCEATTFHRIVVHKRVTHPRLNPPEPLPVAGSISATNNNRTTNLFVQNIAIIGLKPRVVLALKSPVDSVIEIKGLGVGLVRLLLRGKEQLAAVLHLSLNEVTILLGDESDLDQGCSEVSNNLVSLSTLNIQVGLRVVVILDKIIDGLLCVLLPLISRLINLFHHPVNVLPERVRVTDSVDNGCPNSLKNLQDSEPVIVGEWCRVRGCARLQMVKGRVNHLNSGVILSTHSNPIQSCSRAVSRHT